MDRNTRILITAGVAAALVAPVLLDRDDFPLSTYPMYSRTRGEVVTFATAQAIDSGGNTSTLSLGVIGDSDDPLIVAGELRDAIRNGRAQERCEEIAQRAANWRGLPPGSATIEVVTERHDVVVQVEGGQSLLADAAETADRRRDRATRTVGDAPHPHRRLRARVRPDPAPCPASGSSPGGGSGSSGRSSRSGCSSSGPIAARGVSCCTSRT